MWRWDESQDALRAYAVFLGILGAGLLPQAANNQLADLPYFISLAVTTIYIGAHKGLNAKQRQQISFKEGALAPVAASVALFGGYLLVKYLPDISLQTVFDAYFWLLGTVAIAGALAPPLRTLASKGTQPVWKFPLPEWLQIEKEDGEKEKHGELALSDALVVVLAIAAASADCASHHTNFTLNNLIACLIATDILQLVGLSSFRVAAVLLLGLLCYDVFWVFGSPSVIGENVMMTVATSDVLSGPVRLLFPRIPGSVGEASFFPFSLLGLGDVAVPGLLACLALRYDASRAVDMRARGQAAAAALSEAMESLDVSGQLCSPPRVLGVCHVQGEDSSPVRTLLLGTPRPLLPPHMTPALWSCQAGRCTRRATEKMSDRDIAKALGDKAIAAYERVADLELEQRNRTQGTSASGSKETLYYASESVLQQRTYFTPVMLAYIAGLGAAFAANSITQLGQPALLYLVPLTLSAVAVVAAIRGELGQIYSFTDTVTSKTKKE